MYFFAITSTLSGCDNPQPSCHHTTQVTFPLPGNDPTELQPLLGACSPAMFGRGRETLHDEAVRKALQLPADRLALGLTASLPSDDILRDIKDLMLPGAEGPIRAEPYALNIYSPDGELDLETRALSLGFSLAGFVAVLQFSACCKQSVDAVNPAT